MTSCYESLLDQIIHHIPRYFIPIIMSWRHTLLSNGLIDMEETKSQHDLMHRPLMSCLATMAPPTIMVVCSSINNLHEANPFDCMPGWYDNSRVDKLKLVGKALYPRSLENNKPTAKY